MHLAQFNVSWLRQPIDHPDLAPFVAAYDRVLAEASAAPGFVWRHTERTSVARHRLFGRDAIVNLSVWTGPDELAAFMRAGAHLEVMRQRRQFFRTHEGPSLVLWWIEEGARPTLAQAAERLRMLDEQGPGPEAFTLGGIRGAS